MNEDIDHVALLKAWRNGDEAARERLFHLLYDELLERASLLLKHEIRRASLSTGDLVNEALVRLLQSDSVNVIDRNHMLALSAQVMRHVLLDAARRRNRQKRKGINVTLTLAGGAPDSDSVELLALERALVRLKAVDPVNAEIVEMRYFGGMSVEEIATVRNSSPATVKRKWQAARLWLREAIENDIRP